MTQVLFRGGDRRGKARPVLDVSALDLVDHVLNQGVVISGEVLIGIANVDLVYLKLQAVLCSADRMFGKPRKRR